MGSVGVGLLVLALATACGSIAPGGTGRSASQAREAALLPVSPIPLRGPLTPIQAPPYPRSLAAIAFDPLTNQTVMFGGLATGGPLADTWVWDGQGWAKHHLSAGPYARVSGLMAFDSAVRGIVLIGGWPNYESNATIDADIRSTWVWRGSSWQKLATAHTPVPENYQFFWHAFMAFDAASHQLVLVSIAGEPHSPPCTADTWTFDGVDWHHRVPPTALPATVRVLVSDGPNGHPLAVMNPRPALVQQGFSIPQCTPGTDASRALPTPSTWSWSGSTWTELEGTQPPASGPDGDAGGTTFGSHAALVTEHDGVWYWSGNGWTRGAHRVEPPARSLAAIAQDGQGRLVMFGGILQAPPWDLGDTWLWDGRVWQEVSVSGLPASGSR